MNFLILSDLHLEYQAIEFELPPGVDGVILAGDIAEGINGIEWAREAFPDLPVIYVPGNHEFYGREVTAAAKEMRLAAAASNIVLLEKESAEINGIRFLGTTLWTDFALFAGDDEEEQMWSKADASRFVPDFDGRIRCFANGYSVGLTPDIARHWHRRAVTWLAEELAKPFPGKTVVITHHAPSVRSVSLDYAVHPATPAYASRLDHLVKLADFWIHGHLHQACDYRLGKCHVICNPRGYEGEGREFNSKRVVSL